MKIYSLYTPSMYVLQCHTHNIIISTLEKLVRIYTLERYNEIKSNEICVMQSVYSVYIYLCGGRAMECKIILIL